MDSCGSACEGRPSLVPKVNAMAPRGENRGKLLDAMRTELVAALTNAPIDVDADAVDRLREVVRHAGAVGSGPLLTNGCMLGSFALDLSESHPEIRSKLAEQFNALAKAHANPQILTSGVALFAEHIDLLLERAER